jgi:hypothetical protein
MMGDANSPDSRSSIETSCIPAFTMFFTGGASGLPRSFPCVNRGVRATHMFIHRASLLEHRRDCSMTFCTEEDPRQRPRGKRGS